MDPWVTPTLRPDGNIFSTLKIELVYRNSWHTCNETENLIFTYIDGWDNRERIQRDLVWLSPDEYEAAWYAKNVDTPNLTTNTR
ncbi:IS3 family transposase [Plantactinospora solaniradicis]|uniref:IS3 family transposase n=1 Tax=Plantactinospora solaniradicis TaxID=1723736 RepID=A0ABW1K9V5_9ACTN